MLANLNPARTESGKVPAAIALRNMAFDPLFYDVNTLSAKERWGIVAACAKGEYHEGGMLLMQPGESFEYYSTSQELCEKNAALDAVAVPGVGSSPLGTAAFARQIANTIKRPVVGVIAGYGVCDVVAEGMGGWFDFGMRNRALSALDFWQQCMGIRSAEQAVESRKALDVLSTEGSPEEEDVNTVLNIMLRKNDKLCLLVGHSKGALVLQRACDLFLEEEERKLSRDKWNKLGPKVLLATFGCGVSLPKRFSNASQFVGTWDLLGFMNTPMTLCASDKQFEWVSHKFHDLVKDNPFHMPIEEILPQQ
jgi:hypothetical protein